MANWGMIGEALGTALANNYVRRGYNKDIEKAQAAVDTIGNPNAEDNASAYGQVLRERGLSDAIGKDPRRYVEQMKNNYAMAQNSGDTSAMNTSHAQAERMREVAQALRMNMNGFGADDSLENVRGLLGKAVNPQGTPTSNDIGNGLKTLGSPSTFNRPGLGVDTSLGSNSAFAEKVREMVSPSGETEFERNLKSLTKTGNTSVNPAYFSMEQKKAAVPNETITEDKIKSVYGNEIKGLAEQLAANRTKDPWALNKLENQLIGQGMNPDAVRSVLGQERRQMIIESVRENLAKGNHSGAYMDGIMALVNGDKDAAQAIFTGVPTPKEGWNVGVGRENAAIEQGYTLERMGKAHDNSNKTLDNNVGRQKDLSAFTAQLNLQTQNMGREEAFDFTYDKLVAAKVDPREAARLAAGIKPSNSSNSAQQREQKNMLDAAKTIITDRNNYVKQNGTAEGYPNEDMYKQAIGIYGSMLGVGNGNSNGKGNGNGSVIKADGSIDYGEAMRDATGRLAQATQEGGWTRDQIETMFKKLYGGMADKIISDSDWEKYGFPVIRAPR